jgi:hypothetical protein
LIDSSKETGEEKEFAYQRIKGFIPGINCCFRLKIEVLIFFKTRAENYKVIFHNIAIGSKFIAASLTLTD